MLLAAQLKRERHIAGMAIENIVDNISRLVKRPTTEVAHVSEIAEAVETVSSRTRSFSAERCATSITTSNRYSTTLDTLFEQRKFRCSRSVAVTSWLV